MGERAYQRGPLRKAVGNVGRAVRESGFTLVELIVVITVLAVMATVGFLSLSGYSDDARASAMKANVRTVYSAINTEAATNGVSPRYYVVHDTSLTGASLSGAFVFFDANVPTSLSGGDYGTPGTNYTAGNPDYAKLRLNRDKFRVSSVAYGLADTAAAATSTGSDPNYLLVGAVDNTSSTTLSGKKRVVSYLQVAGISSVNKTAFVMGNFTPASTGSGSSSGLIRDMSAGAASTGALVDSATTAVTTGTAAPSGGGSGSNCVFDNPASTFDNCTFGS